MATNNGLARSYTCCGQHFSNFLVALDHFEQAHSVIADNQYLHPQTPGPSSPPSDDGVISSPGSDSGPLSSSEAHMRASQFSVYPSPYPKLSPSSSQSLQDFSSSRSSSARSSTTPSSGSGFGILGTSNPLGTPPQPQSSLNSKPFHCPKPNCNKSYKSANGLKYHISHGICSVKQPGSSSSITGNPSTTTSLPSQVPLFRCPNPNCTHSYKQTSGLKYHMTHCAFAPPSTSQDLNYVLVRLGRTSNTSHDTTNGGLDTTQEQRSYSSTSIPSTTSVSGLSEDKLSEAERRLRPFACGVGKCTRRYKNMNGLRYHYQHSGEHGAAGMALLESGQHDAVARVNGDRIPGSSRDVNVPEERNDHMSVKPRADASHHLSCKGSGSILQPSKSDWFNISGEFLSSSGLHSQPPNFPFLHTILPLDTSWYYSPTPSLRNHEEYGKRPSDTSSITESAPNLRRPRETRRRACEDCRRRKIRCDMSLLECSQCQKSGLQCSFGQAERGRTRYRTRRTQSVPNPQKSDIALPSQLTSFPPPLPFPSGKLSVKSAQRNSQQQLGSKPQRIQSKTNTKTFQPGPEKFGYEQYTSDSPQFVSSGVSRPRSLSFQRPTERDPNFGRPYSRPSSRPTSRPSSRLSSVHGSPVSTMSPWWKSSMSYREDSVKEHAICPPNVDKPLSRLAIPLPTPPVGNKRFRQSVKTNHHRPQRRRYSRAASPHPSSSRPSSRTSFNPPLERRSSFSRSSPGPVSGSSSRPSSRPSSRSSYYSPVQYSPNPSPKGLGSFYSYLPQSSPPFNIPSSSSHKSWSQLS